ncbi:MAG TPA: rhodanese-like domain-containing protein [Pseudogracilibacillus sp.]|nr:rhodanese-like domain-containing protein [Pseudogracilibacillus sp.]
MYDLILIGVTVVFVSYVLKKIIPGRGIGQITTDQLREYLNDESIKKETQFIDVRKPTEYAQFHIPGFRNIPLKEIKKEAKNLNKTQKVVLIDRTGMKGNEAAKRLKRRGFKNIENVQGGLSTWTPVQLYK